MSLWIFYVKGLKQININVLGFCETLHFLELLDKLMINAWDHLCYWSCFFYYYYCHVFYMQTTTTKVQRVKGGTWNKHKKKYNVEYR